MNEVILKLENISYQTSSHKFNKILNNINLEIFRSEIFGLTGESGCGKTTLAKIICGLENQTYGKKFFEGKEFIGIHPSNKIQLLFQNYSATHDPTQKINSSIKELLKLNKVSKDEFFKRTKEVLNLVGLSDEIIHLYPNQLSGGQLQRLALAKLLLLNSTFLILDEPFASQDVVSILNLIKILELINQKLQTTIFCISHEIPLLLKFCNRIGIMKDGEMVEILTLNRNRKKVTIENTPINPYTKSLFQAFELDSLI